MSQSRKDRKKRERQLVLERKLALKEAQRLIHGAKSAPEVLERLKAAHARGVGRVVVTVAASIGCVLIASAAEEAEFFDWLESQGLMPKHHINACGKPDYKADEVQEVIEGLGGVHPASRVKVAM